ncbi:hypothetical protein [Micromonospora sp. C41]|uniref:hypothetical protein n=1 Tax=Micromonospora sp. C41 TaxID=2824878 RepID=UPI001B3841C7|nr:hypothetical protein [Micromonospora sp. C41]MBQ1060061.1 hypothetical protein [Micromonospora sp. C41]
MEILKRLGDAWMYVVDHKDVALALAAIVMSGTSLGWQAITWRRSGVVVKVSVTQAVAAFPTGAEVLTTVTATNAGRASTTVTGWGLRLPGGTSVVMPNPLPISHPLPRRLDGHDEGSWYIKTEDLRRHCAEHGTTEHEARGFVRLGNGKTVLASKRGIGTAKEKQPAG